jgi:hypothetical protein
LSPSYDRYPAPPPYGGWSAPYGAPPPPPPPPPRRNRAVVAWTVAGSLLAATVLAVIAVGGFRMGSAGFADALAAPSTAPPADWAVIGDDEGLDAYAERCHGGAMDACDDLYSLAEVGSAYEHYGLTCGGRVQPYDVPACTVLE